MHWQKFTQFFSYVVVLRFSIVREARCRDIWLRRINSKKLFDKSEHQLRQYSVCQNHFVTDCIAENGKLRRFSLPTLNLPGKAWH